MKDEATGAITRVKQYAYVDGLVEIAAGILFCAIGLLFTVEARAQPGSPLAGLSAIGLPVIVLGGVWLSGRAVAIAKEKIVYPRTGKVEYRQPTRGSRILVGAAAAVVAVVVVVAVAALGETALSWLPLLTATVIGVFLLYYGYEVRLIRYALLGVVSAVLGAAASIMADNEKLGSAGYFWAMGACLVAVGVFVLWMYLRSYSLPGDESVQTERAS